MYISCRNYFVFNHKITEISIVCTYTYIHIYIYYPVDFPTFLRNNNSTQSLCFPIMIQSFFQYRDYPTQLNNVEKCRSWEHLELHNIKV